MERKALIILTEELLGSLPAVDLRMREQLGLTLEDPSGSPLPYSALSQGTPFYVRFGSLRLSLEELNYDPVTFKEILGVDLEITPLSWPAYSLSLDVSWSKRKVWSPALRRLANARNKLLEANPKTKFDIKITAGSYPFYVEAERPTFTLVLPAPLVPFFKKVLEEAKAGDSVVPARGLYGVTELNGETLLLQIEKVEENKARVFLQNGEQVVLPLSSIEVFPKEVRVALYLFHLGRERTFKLGYDELVYRLKSELGFRDARVITLAAPFQLEGEDEDGRPVYFRERGGVASLDLGYDPGSTMDEALKEDRYVEVEREWVERGKIDETFNTIKEMYLQAKRVLLYRLGELWSPASAFKLENNLLKISLTPPGKKKEHLSIQNVLPGVYLVLSGDKLAEVRVEKEKLVHPEILEAV